MYFVRESLFFPSRGLWCLLCWIPILQNGNSILFLEQNHKSIGSLWFPMVPYQSSPSWKYNRYIFPAWTCPKTRIQPLLQLFQGPVVRCNRPEETRRAEHWVRRVRWGEGPWDVLGRLQLTFLVGILYIQKTWSFVGITWCFFWMINQQHPNYMCLWSLKVTWLVNTCHLFFGTIMTFQNTMGKVPIKILMVGKVMIYSEWFMTFPTISNSIGTLHGYVLRFPRISEFVESRVYWATLLNFMNWSMTKYPLVI